jgi:hypothetical protein
MKMKSRMLEVLTVIVVVVVIGITFHKNYMTPRKLVKSSISPDSSLRVEFLTEGYWGKSWVDIISLKSSNNRVTIYSESGNEVMFPSDLKIFWSNNSSTFLATSKKSSTIPLNQNRGEFSLIQTESGEKLVLMYSFLDKTLRHNLYSQPDSSTLSLRISDVTKIDWYDCSICR